MLTRDDLAELRGYVRALDGLARMILDAQRERPPGPGLLLRQFLQGQATSLSDYSSSCERIFERISVHLKGGIPEDVDWHRALLDRMTLDVPGVRPPVISSSTRDLLDDLRKFRHAMRHLYGIEVDSKKLQRHLDALPALDSAIVPELEAFLKTMEAIVD